MIPDWQDVYDEWWKTDRAERSTTATAFKAGWNKAFEFASRELREVLNRRTTTLEEIETGV